MELREARSSTEHGTDLSIPIAIRKTAGENTEPTILLPMHYIER